MAAERSTATAFGFVGGLVASIIVALVSTWMAAEADRTEALRRERRSAYADLIARAVTCESVTSLGFLREPEPPIPTLDELRDFSDDEIQELIDRVNADTAARNEERFLTLQECTVPLQASMANVVLLSESAAITDAGHDLVNETIRLVTPSEARRDERQEKYFAVLSRFQVLARASIDAPAVSAALIQLGGFVLIQLLLLVALLSLVTRFHGLTRERSPSEAEESDEHSPGTEGGDAAT